MRWQCSSAVGEAADDDARQAVLALEPHQVALEDDDSRISRPGLCGTISRQFSPAAALAPVPRTMRKSSAPSELVVMIEPLAVVLDRIFVAVLARRTSRGRALRRSASIRWTSVVS